MSPGKRPLGVSIIAILGFVSVGIYLVLFGLAIALPNDLRSVLEGLSPQGAGPSALLNLGPAVAVYLGVMIVVAAAYALGMWTLRNWARWITILIASISLLATIAGVASLTNNLTVSTITAGLVRVGLSLLVLWYLFRPAVREAFTTRGGK